MKLADRMSRLGTESAFEVLAQAKVLEAQGKKIVHMEIGEPDFDTLAHIVEAAHAAMTGGGTRYTDTGGTAELKAAIRRKFKREKSPIWQRQLGNE